jgi:glycosyltransferase involved in cell wall biosynthesis
MMCRARFVVLPIRDTVQPSGQSACLQAMACGKAVVLTDFGGLWNRELMKDQVTCILAGPPGSVSGIQHGVERLLENPLEIRRIGDQARAVVADKLTVDHMAWHVSKILESSGESQKDTSTA